MEPQIHDQDSQDQWRHKTAEARQGVIEGVPVEISRLEGSERDLCLVFVLVWVRVSERPVPVCLCRMGCGRYGQVLMRMDPMSISMLVPEDPKPGGDQRIQPEPHQEGNPEGRQRTAACSTPGWQAP